MLSEAGKATVDAARARRAWVWDDSAPRPTPGARDIGMVALVGIGCQIWSRERVKAEDGQVGGIVVDEWRDLDHETGEWGERRFLVMDRWRGRLRWCAIALGEIDAAMVEAPSSAAVVRMVRALWAEMSTRKGLLDSTDVARMVLATRLVDSLMGGAIASAQREWGTSAWRLLTETPRQEMP